ncbi:MAG: pentapeptide repeat-containing protein [Verrucomicrobiota bacterium]
MALFVAAALFPVCLFGAIRSAPKLLLDSPTLTASEKFVLAQVIAGKSADLKSEFADETNRVLRAAFLEALLTQKGTNVHRNGFFIEHAVILEPLDLHNAEVHFETSLVGCRFAGEINFSKSIFENGFSLAGSTFASPATFKSAQIIGNLIFDGSVFVSTNALINFEEVKVGGVTSFVGCRFAGYVSFKDAKFAALDFSKVTWPAVHDDNPWLWLNGMTYTRISAGEKDSWQNLYNLVQRTAHGPAYSADIFARLDEYYRKLGYPRQADTFFRAQKKREREEVLSGPSWAWSFFLEQFVGYGRSPERAIFWSVAIIGFGFVMFRPNRMEPQKSEYVGRKFSPFWYSVDVYLPIIKLRDAEIWKPKEEYVMTNVWRRIHTILGWALIPIAIAVWTGMLSH